ncbi:MAG: CDP-alcohol phosphatidyltransferase family protein [Clostridia bacterium]|nr:CDP-alcohol phosphatidyltransferase family protein [Clostridia bacterium]
MKKKTFSESFFNSIPNILSVFRIILIPFFIIFYAREMYIPALITLVISGCTDTLDGTIARRFNSITELGKVLDPLADKLTQLAIGVMISIRYVFVAPMIALLVIKEVSMIIFSYRLLKLGAQPIAALWWGKLATAVFYVVTCFIVAFGHYIVDTPIGRIVLFTLTGITTALMVFAFIRYIPLFVKAYKDVMAKMKQEENKD